MSAWTVTTITERLAASRSASLGELPHPTHLGLGDIVDVGREGEVLIGVDPPDMRVSRHAVAIHVDGKSWNLQIFNSHDVVFHPWGLKSYRVSHSPAEAMQLEQVHWPRVAVRVLGSPDLLHWVLLESTAPSAQIAGRPPVTRQETSLVEPGETDTAPGPRELTQNQLEILHTVFEPQLAWPPSLNAPLLLKQAAHRLDKSVTAVRNALNEARNRALALGLPPSVTATEPDCLHLLVAAGLVRPRFGTRDGP